jgi:hypothetical protein
MRHALKQPKGEKHLIIFRSDITEFGLKTGIFVKKKRILHYLKTAMKKVLIVKNFLSIPKEKKEKKNIYFNF